MQCMQLNVKPHLSRESMGVQQPLKAYRRQQRQSQCWRSAPKAPCAELKQPNKQQAAPSTGSPGSSGQAGLLAPIRHLLDEAVNWMQPRERGDIRDVTLMASSMSALVLLSMQLFRVYAWLYYAAGLRPLLQRF